MKKISEWDIFKDRTVRIWTAVAAILLFAAGSVFLIWVLYLEMFTGNQRFTLQKVLVESRGFWQGRKELICDILRLKPGETNLFRMDPGAMRNSLLLHEPSIQYVKVVRELPDTLHINIVERVPVALVNSARSPLVVDSEAILMLRERCMNITSSLPVIIGLPNSASYPPGGAIQKFKNAVDLIMLTKTAYPDVRIASISVKQKDQLICAIRYRNGDDIYRVLMPDRNLSQNLQVLVSTLDTMRRTRNPKRVINLLFRNQVIITDAPSAAGSPRS